MLKYCVYAGFVLVTLNLLACNEPMMVDDSEQRSGVENRPSIAGEWQIFVDTSREPNYKGSRRITFYDDSFDRLSGSVSWFWGGGEVPKRTGNVKGEILGNKIKFVALSEGILNPETYEGEIIREDMHLEGYVVNVFDSQKLRWTAKRVQ